MVTTSDLARLYECKNGTKTVNLAVKKHINRFPERFMFPLTEEESKIIWFQFETKNPNLETKAIMNKFFMVAICDHKNRNKRWKI